MADDNIVTTTQMAENITQLDLNLADLSARFGWEEYTVFGFMLGLSAAIGIYFGFIKVGDKTADDYLLAGRKMEPLPMSMSLIAR